jgi:hypothetical protein
LLNKTLGSWFEDTLQGAVIILAEKKQKKDQKSEGVGVVNVSGFEFLKEDPNVLFNNTVGINGETVAGKLMYIIMTYYFFN